MTDHDFLLPTVASASLVFLLSLMFVEHRRSIKWYGLCSAVAVVALALPFMTLLEALGSANPDPSQGDFSLVGWKSDEHAGLVYLYLKPTEAEAPHLVAVPFEYRSALELHERAKLAGAAGHLQITISRSETDQPLFHAGFDARPGDRGAR